MRSLMIHGTVAIVVRRGRHYEPGNFTHLKATDPALLPFAREMVRMCRLERRS